MCVLGGSILYGIQCLGKHLLGNDAMCEGRLKFSVNVTIVLTILEQYLAILVEGAT